MCVPGAVFSLRQWSTRRRASLGKTPITDRRARLLVISVRASAASLGRACMRHCNQASRASTATCIALMCRTIYSMPIRALCGSAERNALRAKAEAFLAPDEWAKVAEWWKPENMFSGEDIWEVLRRRLGDERAQEVIKEQGYKGITGIGDGQEIVVFDPKDVRLIQRQLEQTRRGKIRLATDDAKATITLFKDADASTFIHETGHHWLEELIRDAADERAPPDLIGRCGDRAAMARRRRRRRHPDPRA
jgi:hypothetical protein